MASDMNLATKFASLQDEYTKKYESMAGDSHSDLDF
jgi:hypothetical protein